MEVVFCVDVQHCLRFCFDYLDCVKMASLQFYHHPGIQRKVGRWVGDSHVFLVKNFPAKKKGKRETVHCRDTTASSFVY
jgi:hypothetical protein